MNMKLPPLIPGANEVFFLDEKRLPEGVLLAAPNYNSEIVVYSAFHDRIFRVYPERLGPAFDIAGPSLLWKDWVLREAKPENLLDLSRVLFNDNQVTGMGIWEYTNRSTGHPIFLVKACRDETDSILPYSRANVLGESMHLGRGERRLASS